MRHIRCRHPEISASLSLLFYILGHLRVVRAAPATVICIVQVRLENPHIGVYNPVGCVYGNIIVLVIIPRVIKVCLIHICFVDKGFYLFSRVAIGAVCCCHEVDIFTAYKVSRSRPPPYLNAPGYTVFLGHHRAML